MAAAALQEVVGAPVVGSRSAGAVLQSVLRTLMVTGYMFQYPISDYITLHGVRLEGNGVTVNADVPAPQPGQKDAAVDVALALLRRAELRNERFGEDNKGL
jgi:C-terminal processing protease CtpA/Prc